MVSFSAPGKIILFGEHAVVYGRPALAVPVTQVQATATVSADWSADFEADKRIETDRSTDFETYKRIKTDRSTGFEADKRIKTDLRGKEIWIDAPDIGLRGELSRLAPDNPLAAVVRGVFSTLTSSPAALLRGEGCTITITSTIPVASGLGSGAAVSVAIIRALSSFLHSPLTDAQVSALAYEVEKLHHGTPSGIDNTVVTYAKPVYFVKGQPLEILQVGAPFTIVIGYTGVSAPTKESVGDVRKLWEADSPRWEKVFDDIGAIAKTARGKIKKGAWMALGPLMNANHALLQALTVSSPELDRLVDAARGSGALGAKLSGGGRGGDMIALVQPEKAEHVAAALEAAGAKRVLTTTVLSN